MAAARPPMTTAAVWPAGAPSAPTVSLQVEAWTFTLRGFRSFDNIFRPAWNIAGTTTHTAASSSYDFCAFTGAFAGVRFFKKKTVTTTMRRYRTGATDPGDNYDETATHVFTEEWVYDGAGGFSFVSDSETTPSGGVTTAGRTWESAYLEDNPGATPEDVEDALHAYLAANSTVSVDQGTLSMAYDWDSAGGTAGIEATQTFVLSAEDTFADLVDRVEYLAGLETPLGTSVVVATGDQAANRSEFYIRASDADISQESSHVNPGNRHSDAGKCAHVIRYRHSVSAAFGENVHWRIKHKVKSLTAAPATVPVIATVPDRFGAYSGPIAPSADYASTTTEVHTWADLAPDGMVDRHGFPSNAADPGWSAPAWSEIPLPGSGRNWIQTSLQPNLTQSPNTAIYRIRLVAYDGRAGWTAKLRFDRSWYDSTTFDYHNEEYLLALGSTTSGVTTPLFFGAAPGLPTDPTRDSETANLIAPYLADILDPDGNPIDPATAGQYLRLEVQRRANEYTLYTAPNGDKYQRWTRTKTFSFTQDTPDGPLEFYPLLEAAAESQTVESYRGTDSYVSWSASINETPITAGLMVDVLSALKTAGSIDTATDVAAGTTRTITTTRSGNWIARVVKQANLPAFAGARPANCAPAGSLLTTPATAYGTATASATVVAANAPHDGSAFRTPWTYLAITDPAAVVCITRGWAKWFTGTGT